MLKLKQESSDLNSTRYMNNRTATPTEVILYTLQVKPIALLGKQSCISEHSPIHVTLTRSPERWPATR